MGPIKLKQLTFLDVGVISPDPMKNFYSNILPCTGPGIEQWNQSHDFFKLSDWPIPA